MRSVGFHTDVPADEYHADPAAEPSLSAHSAAVLLSRSPEHAYITHPRLGACTPIVAPKEFMVVGDIIHSFLLGGGKDIAIIDADTYQTKAAKQERDDAIKAGKVPVKRAAYENAKAAAGEIRKVLPVDFAQARATEATCIWKSGGVHCRARLDSLFQDGHWDVYDLKTCDNARVSAAARNLIGRGNHIQAASNIDGIETLFPEAAGRVRFFDLFVETEAPYGVIVVEVAGAMLEYGQRQWRRAKGVWERCLGTKTWPGYSKEPIRVEPPSWMLSDEMDAAIAENATPPF
jgi:hypothetical protein